MPEGYRASVILDSRSALEVCNVCYMMQSGVPTMVGDGADLVAAAGYNGQLYYFPLQRSFGVPVMLMGHPLRLKFWWLFRQFAVPEAGVMFPMSWIHTQPEAVLMSIAEFVAPVMNRMLEVRLETDHNLREANLETWLAELVVMLTDNENIQQQITSVVPHHLREVDLDGEELPLLLQHYTYWFGDGSALILDGDGYQMVQAPVCLVPVRGNTLRRATEFRTVNVHDSSMTAPLQLH